MINKFHFPLFLIPFILISTFVTAQNDPKIRELFSQFQTGYRLRDTTKALQFSKDLFTQDILIVGTGNNESIQGLFSAQRLIFNDWAYWLNLQIDTSKLIVHTHQHSADFVISGNAFIRFPNKEAAYDYANGRLKQIIDLLPDSKSKVLSYSKEAAGLIQEIESGNLEFKYSIRITGELQFSNDKWKFSQLVYSFPYPMNRE